MTKQTPPHQKKEAKLHQEPYIKTLFVRPSHLHQLNSLINISSTLLSYQVILFREDLPFVLIFRTLLPAMPSQSILGLAFVVSTAFAAPSFLLT